MKNPYTAEQKAAKDDDGNAAMAEAQEQNKKDIADGTVERDDVNPDGTAKVTKLKEGRYGQLARWITNNA